MKLTTLTFLIGILLVGCSATPTEEEQENSIVTPPVQEEVEEAEELDDADDEEELEESDDGEDADTEKESEDAEEPMEEETTPEPVAEARTIMLRSTNWAFAPNVITVKKGEDISFHLMGMEGNHGFAIPELGINETMGQGEMKMIQIPTDTPGVYTFFCNLVCGPGHGDMNGTLIIEE